MLLKTGVSARGAVFGPMSEVVVQKPAAFDRRRTLSAMAVYLKSLPQTPAPADAARVAGAPTEMPRVMTHGAKLYEKHCADCHAATATACRRAYPPLAGNRALTMRSPVNPIRIVLNGGFPPGTAGNPRPYGMPPFRPTLNDDEVAAWSLYPQFVGQSRGLVSPLEVDRFRSAPVD